MHEECGGIRYRIGEEMQAQEVWKSSLCFAGFLLGGINESFLKE